MNITVEALNIELSPEWKRRVESRLRNLSDPQDPVINARTICSYHQGQQPPAEVNLVVNLRGKNIVITKRGEHVDAALKKALDTLKREIRQFYDLRIADRGRVATPAELAAVQAQPVAEETE
ncbi:MAG: HPF/RaiA family ribosome-associated protein [Bradymonadales bacterium]|nr:HPF/RaiA family ribosome-associated protein [Bradymonadales bacterium]